MPLLRLQRLVAILAMSLLAPTAAMFVVPQAAGAHRARTWRHHHRRHRVHAAATPAPGAPAQPSWPAPSPAPSSWPTRTLGPSPIVPVPVSLPAPAPTTPPAQTTPPGGTSPLTWSEMSEPSFEAPGSVWNTPLAPSAPLDPSSSALSAAIYNMTLSNGSALDVMHWSTPIYIVPADQPTVSMHLDTRNAPLQAAFAAVPVPPDAQPAIGTDEVMIIYQPSTDTMWESWHTQLESDGWHFGYGGRMIDFSQSPGYYQTITASDGTPLEEPWWGNSASGLPIADTVISFRDLANGYIDHALGMLLPHSWIRAHVVAWPAARTDGSSTAANSVPEGARFRLDPNFDISSLPPLTRMIALAAQRYGLIVRDGSSTVNLDGQAPRTPAETAAWQAVMAASHFKYWSDVLKSFPWSHLQLLQMTVSPYPAP